MAERLSDALRVFSQAFQSQLQQPSVDTRALSEEVDQFVSHALEALRLQVAPLHPDAAAALQTAVEKSAIAQHKRRDFTRALPPELVVDILRYLDWNDIGNAARVNRRLSQCARDAATPLNVVRLANLPHVWDRIWPSGPRPSGYGSAPLRPARNHELAASCTPEGVNIFRMESGSLSFVGAHPTARSMEPNPRWMRTCSMAWHPEGTHFAVQGEVGDRLMLQVVAVDNLGTPEMCIPMLAEERDAVLSWSAGNPDLLAVSSKERTQVFDLRSPGAPILALPAPKPVTLATWGSQTELSPPYRMQWSPHGVWLSLANSDGALDIWDFADSGSPVRKAIPSVVPDHMTVVAWHARKAIFMVATQETVSIMEPGDHKPLYTVPTRALLAKFPGMGANMTWVTGTSSSDWIHASWEPTGHDYMVIMRYGSTMFARWDGGAITPIRYKIGSGGSSSASIAWRDPDGVETYESGSSFGIYKLRAANHRRSPHPREWRDGALGTPREMRPDKP